MVHFSLEFKSEHTQITKSFQNINDDDFVDVMTKAINRYKVKYDISLDCSGNKLTKLPDNFPEKLTCIDCSDNQLLVLPDDLPSGLTELYCHNNQLTKLPNNLPQKLFTLNCSNNLLTELPENLPQEIVILCCSGNQLTKLPDNLPHKIEILECQCNQIVGLPDNLPQRITGLHCRNNLLANLPYSLINCKQLEYIDISHNPVEYASVYQDTQSVRKLIASIVQAGGEERKSSKTKDDANRII